MTTTYAAGRERVDPTLVFEAIGGATRYWVLSAAIELGIFEALHPGDADIDELSSLCGAPADRVSVLLEVLADMGLVVAVDGSWEATATARACLSGGGHPRLDELVRRGPGAFENLLALGDTVRGEPPPRALDHDDGFWRSMFSATFSAQRQLAGATHDLLHLRHGARMTEIGPCAGAWAIALLQTDEAALASVEGRPGVRASVTSCAAEAGVAGRLSVDGPAEPADVVVVANAVRLCAPADRPALLASAVARAKDGGAVVVVDYMVDAPGRAGAVARLMAVTSLANTSTGGACRGAEVAAWLTTAGCVDVELREPLPGFTVVTCRHTPSRRETAR